MDGAEADLAAIGVAVKRLPAGGFVRAKLEAALEDLAAAVARGRRGAAAPAPVAAAAPGVDIAAELERALASAGDEAPRTRFEAASCVAHFSLLAAAPDLRTVGAAAAAAALGGFAAPARPLAAAAGPGLPRGWRREGGGAFRYRSASTGEAFELACAGVRGALSIAFASRTRGQLAAAEVPLARGADPAGGLGDADAERIAGVAREALAPRAAPAAPAPAPVPRPVPGFAPPVPRPVPGFAPPVPRPVPGRLPFDDGGGLLVGPRHPGWGGGDPLRADRFAPRYDPVGPGDVPGGLGPFGGAPTGGRRRRVPGEPDPDHFRLPGHLGDDDAFI